MEKRLVLRLLPLLVDWGSYEFVITVSLQIPCWPSF